MIEAEQLDTIFTEELAKFKYKPNFFFRAIAFCWMRGTVGYEFTIVEHHDRYEAPIRKHFGRTFPLEEFEYSSVNQIRERVKMAVFRDIREYEMVQLQEHFMYDGIQVQPPTRREY